MDIHSSFFQSLLQMSGTIIGLAVAFYFLSLLSSFFGRFSKMKTQTSISILPDAEGKKRLLGKSAPVILQINLKGVIGKEELDSEQIETLLVESQMGDLRGNRVKGVLLSIDSPGGAAADSDTLYRRIKAYKKKYSVPVYAFVDGMCASGGLLIACSADKIYASPSSVIGSVGVRLMLPFFNVHKVLEKWEIGVKTFAEGKHKDHLNPFRPWQEEEDSDLKNVLSHSYHRFVDIVAKERPKLTKEKLIEEVGAQIYSAPESAALGFVDEGESDYSFALEALVEAAGINKKQPYQVVELKKKKPWLKEMMASSPILTGKVQHELKLGPFTHSHRHPEIAYLYTQIS